MSSCPLCAATVPGIHLEDAGRIYLRCDNCALIFLRPDLWPTPLQEVLRYQQHNNDGGDERYVRFLRRLVDPLLTHLPEGARGLDFGCGPAPVLAQLLTAAGRPTASYDPLFYADVSLLRGTYDFVSCSEVMEHVHDPSELFSTFATLLRNGGTLGIMTRFHGVEAPFSEWWYRRDPTHVCFYCEGTMAWIARERGWSLECDVPNVAIFTVPKTPVPAPAGALSCPELRAPCGPVNPS